ncbi:MAG: type II toxin-antitoxin system prevent-host-death family antitoxin, partial [Clostridiales bacterium]|nr:type II toxin-antitoxin system prevent-host-death family antitoxin [Clostridiales bacterium]
MYVDTDVMVSMTEANQNFSRVARLADEKGSVLILKNNAPRYLLIDFTRVGEVTAAPDEDILAVSAKLIEKNRAAYE